MIVSTCLWRTSEDLQSSMLLSPIPHTQTGRSSSGPLPSFLRSVPPPPCPHVALLHGNYSLPPTPLHSHSPGCVPTHPCPLHAIGRRAHLDTSHLLLAGGKHFAGSHSGRRQSPRALDGAQHGAQHTAGTHSGHQTSAGKHTGSLFCSLPLHIFSSLFI